MQHMLLTLTLTLTLPNPNPNPERRYHTRVAHSMWLVVCWCSRQQLAWARVRVRVRVRVDALKRVRNGRIARNANGWLHDATTASGRKTYLPAYPPWAGLRPEMRENLPT